MIFSSLACLAGYIIWLAIYFQSDVEANSVSLYFFSTIFSP